MAIGEFVAIDDGLGTVFIELYDQKSRIAGAKIYTSPQAAQTEAALSEVVRLSEDAGLYNEFLPETKAGAVNKVNVFSVPKLETHTGAFQQGWQPAETGQTEAQEREAFEAWASNDGAWTRAIERDGADYKLMQTSSNWRAWKAARARAGSKP